jgi:hypothetical protein
MLRSEIVSGLESLLAAMADADVPNVVELVYRHLSRQGTEEVKTTDVLTCYQKFMLSLTSKFGEVEKRMMRVLDINEFTETEWWGQLIGAASGGLQMPDPAVIGRPLYRLRFVIDYLPNVIALIKQDGPAVAKGRGPGRIVLQLSEENDRHSSPARVIAAIEAVTQLYQAFADLLGLPESDLMLQSCDAGIDKTFTFSGLPELTERVVDCLLEVWRNAIYFREKKFNDKLDLIAKALPVLGDVAYAEEQSRIAPERAELLRRKIIGAAQKFIETGSTIPEMYNFTNYVPRQLLAPKEALLLEGK